MKIATPDTADACGGIDGIISNMAINDNHSNSNSYSNSFSYSRNNNNSLLTTTTTITSWSVWSMKLNGRQWLAASFSLMMILSSMPSSCSAYVIGGQTGQTGTTGTERSSSSVTQQQQQQQAGAVEEEESSSSSPFYLPTDEALRQFQQIVLRGLGLTKLPDLSKVQFSNQQQSDCFKKLSSIRRCTARRP